RSRPSLTWPHGHVDVQLSPIAAPVPDRARPGVRNRENAERQTVQRPLRIEQDRSLITSPIQWLATLDSTELVGRDGNGDEVIQQTIAPNNWPQQFRDSNYAQAARLGRLLVASIGGQLIAVDRQGS